MKKNVKKKEVLEYIKIFKQNAKLIAKKHAEEEKKIKDEIKTIRAKLKELEEKGTLTKELKTRANTYLDELKTKREYMKQSPFKVILVYSETCGACHKQFNYMRKTEEHHLGVTFTKGQNLKNKHRVVDRIYPMEYHSKEFFNYTKKYFPDKTPDKTPWRTPTWINARTNKIVAIGIQTGGALEDLTNFKKEKMF